MKEDPSLSEIISNWPVPGEYLLEIGRVAQTWVILENYVDVCLGKLTGFQITDVRPFIVLRHASFPQKLDALDALCHFIHENSNDDEPGKRLKHHKEVTAKIRSVQNSRNKLMHNVIGKHEEKDGFQLLSGTARGKVKLDASDVRPETIRKVAMDIHLALLDLHELITGVRIPPLWERKGTPYENYKE